MDINSKQNGIIKTLMQIPAKINTDLTQLPQSDALCRKLFNRSFKMQPECKEEEVVLTV